MDSHTERKLVIGINYPDTARLEVQRIKVDEYDKEMFLQMRAYYKIQMEKDRIAIARNRREEENWDDVEGDSGESVYSEVD